MKQSSVDEGKVKIIKFPCTTIGTCPENEEDYDPCANGHNITDKDLEFLSRIKAGALKSEAESKVKQEQDKESGKGKLDKEKVGRDLKQEGGGKNIQDDDKRWNKEKSERNLKQEGGEKNIQKNDDRSWSKEKSEGISKQEGGGRRNQKDENQTWSKEQSERNLKQEGGEKRIEKGENGTWSKEQSERNLKQEGGGKNIQGDDRRWNKEKSERNLKQEDGGKTFQKDKESANVNSGRETVGDDDDAAAAAAAASTVKLGRKTCHKKVKKDPFHRDRLALPSCVSPPPRFPPPQLHPPADELEEVKCRKPRKSKPCRKKTGNEDFKTKPTEKSKSDGREQDIKTKQDQYYEGTREETKGRKGKKGSTEEEEEMTGKGLEEVERRMSEAKAARGSAQGGKFKKSGEPLSRYRKPCTRRVRKPCKKKVSETSISLLPPVIPPLQRDLPSTSPKNIPEVKRQTLMAEETKRVEKQQRCKNRRANKAKNK